MSVSFWTWAFDGIGAATFGALLTVAVTRAKSGADNNGSGPTLAQNSQQADLAVGHGGSVTNSAVISGSHNVVHLNSPNRTNSTWLDLLLALSFIAVLILAMLTIVEYPSHQRTGAPVSYHPANSQNPASFNSAGGTPDAPEAFAKLTLAVGVEGDFIPFGGAVCESEGVKCIREEAFRDKVVEVFPEPSAPNTVRAVLLVSVYNASGFIDRPEIQIVSSSSGAWLDYVTFVDPSRPRSLKFTPMGLEANSNGEGPTSFSFLVHFEAGARTTRLSIRVNGVDLQELRVQTTLALGEHGRTNSTRPAPGNEPSLNIGTITNSGRGSSTVIEQNEDRERKPR